jgi:hypothetical protein
MPVDLSGTEDLTRQAVATYWRTLEEQSARQAGGAATDQGRRSAVTGGKQMDGFCSLIKHVLLINGLKDSHVFMDTKLELPGYFRPTKKWDLLVIHNGVLLAAMEFKSQRGPSFGNNFNNRTEEAVGTGHDFATACREGILGGKHPMPWLGWVMLLEDCAKSKAPVEVAEPHFKVFREFREASYAKRYELLLRKLVREKLYDCAAFITATAEGGSIGDYTEPASDLTMRMFLANLAGHVAAHVAGK